MKTHTEESNFENEENRIVILTQQMLMCRRFVGSFIGRFYVNSLKLYRDVIKIHHDEETFKRDLEVVKERLHNFNGGKTWPAITCPGDTDSPDGHNLWLSLKNIPFGTYVFEVKDVTFFKSEIIIKVKTLSEFDSKETLRNTSNSTTSGYEWDNLKNNLTSFLEETITWKNTKESIKFTFVLIMTILTTLLYSLQYLGDYSIRFFREFNNLIKVCTPIVIAILDLISKTIGGFYILIAMLWRGNGIPPQFPSLNAPPRHQYPQLKAAPKRPYYH